MYSYINVKLTRNPMHITLVLLRHAVSRTKLLAKFCSTFDPFSTCSNSDAESFCSPLLSILVGLSSDSESRDNPVTVRALRVSSHQLCDLALDDDDAMFDLLWLDLLEL